MTSFHSNPLMNAHFYAHNFHSYIHSYAVNCTPSTLYFVSLFSLEEGIRSRKKKYCRKSFFEHVILSVFYAMSGKVLVILCPLFY